MTSRPEYGHCYSADKISLSQWNEEHSDKAIITYEEARGLMRERGNELMERGYMDREQEASESESDSGETRSPLGSNYYLSDSGEGGNDSDCASGELIARM